MTPSEQPPGVRRRVLVCDDERNIRLTLSQVLESMGLDVDTAVNGQDALERLGQQAYGLLLLDVRMPGLDGMEVLRRVREVQPGVRVIMITAHGTVESAVEAMKLGAVDFIQKPFSVDEIRALVRRVQERERLRPEDADTYEAFIELARHEITRQQLEAAAGHAREALALDDTQPEAYNLLGILCEIRDERYEAQQYYRKALELDPTYQPARANLRQSVEKSRKGSFLLDEVKKADLQGRKLG